MLRDLGVKRRMDRPVGVVSVMDGILGLDAMVGGFVGCVASGIYRLFRSVRDEGISEGARMTFLGARSVWPFRLLLSDEIGSVNG